MFKDNSLLIMPDNIKNEVIYEVRKNNLFTDITFITKSDFIKKVTFDYDKNAIYYLINKYNIKYEVAKVYLDNIYYIDNIKYDSSKLNFLVNIKNELLENNLLIIDNIYIKYISSKNIYLYKFNYIDKYFNKLLSNFDNIEVINKEYNNYEINTIYEYDTLEDEVLDTTNKICKLLEKNIDINDIKIYFNSSYTNVISKIFDMYNIPININKTSIYNTYLGNYFINNLSSDITVLLDEIKSKNTEIYKKIVNILNNYTFIKDYTKVKEMLIYEFKNTYIETKYDNKVELIDLKNNNINDNMYVFVLGFNQAKIPNIYKDEDYITDNIASIVNIENTYEKNKIEYNTILSNLKNIKNLILSYPLNNNEGECFISSMCEEFNYTIKHIKIDNYNYSNKYNKIKLTSYLDNLVNYGYKDKDLELLYSNYDVKYRSFDNKYKKINKDKLYKYLNNKLLLSYSNLDNYNKCAFRYYLSNILKISIYEDKFMANIGSIFHYVLSNMNKENFSLDNEYNNAIKSLNKDFTIKEKFFLKKLKSELEFIINTINKQLTNSTLDNYLYEEEIYTNIEGNIKITFMGKIDKILYKKIDNKTIVAIIDYKTGNESINLDNIIYGLNMQLPIYLYLSKNSKKIDNISFAGFYLQKILNNEIKKDYKNDYLKLKENNLKLNGYSNNDISILSKFDKSYDNSMMIKSMKTTKDGFYYYSKVLSSDDIEKIIKITENKIKENAKSIENAIFDINPKRQNNELLGCSFCKFSDICFRKEEDIVDIEEKNIEEILKGDIDEYNRI